MNNNQQKKEYKSDEEVIHFITENSAHAQPKKESFKRLLDKIQEDTPSPYLATRSNFLVFQKSFVFAFVAMLFFSGGAIYLQHKNNQPLSPSTNTLTSTTDVSDQGLANDVTNIDIQMSNLDADNQYVY